MRRVGRACGMVAGGLASSLAWVGLVTLSAFGCGGGSSSGVDGGPGNAVVLHPPWKELPQPSLSVEGGTALSARGQGQPGGTVHLVAQGDVSFDPLLHLKRPALLLSQGIVYAAFGSHCDYGAYHG